MLQAGATQRHATAQFGVTQSVVQRIWQTPKERPKGGRPRRRQRRMAGLLSGERTKAHTDKLDQMTFDLGITISIDFYERCQTKRDV